MCTVCKLARVGRNHRSTLRHRRALNPVSRIAKTRKAPARRDWDAEAHEAWIVETFGSIDDMSEPAVGTYYAEAFA